MANPDWRGLVTIRIFRSVFRDVLVCLKIVFNFLLSGPSLNHEDSDSERESFQKIHGEKFKRAQGSTHGAKIKKNMKILHVVRVWNPNFATGPALRAMFKSIWLVETVLERPWLESNIIPGVANPGWRGLVTIRIFRSFFRDVLVCLKIVFSFLLPRSSFDHKDSDSEWESFQKIYGEKF